MAFRRAAGSFLRQSRLRKNDAAAAGLPIDHYQKNARESSMLEGWVHARAQRDKQQPPSSRPPAGMCAHTRKKTFAHGLQMGTICSMLITFYHKC